MGCNMKVGFSPYDVDLLLGLLYFDIKIVEYKFTSLKPPMFGFLIKGMWKMKMVHVKSGFDLICHQSD